MQRNNREWILLLSVLPISIFGLLTMSSFVSGDSYFIKQSIWIILGTVVYIVLSRFDISFIKNTNAVLFLYSITNLMLVATLFIGNTVKGSKAWFSFGGISLQPADFAKLALIILLAKYFSKRHVEIAQARHILVSLVYTAIPISLVMLQPDFGSAMVLLGIWFVMVLASGLSKKHLFIMMGLGLAAVSIMWVFVLKDNQKARILNFVDPTRDIRGSGYNVFQSEIAIGSGQLFGKGVGYGTQSRLSFLPEHETDFIFAAFAEEWGFVGVSIVLILYATLSYRLLLSAYRARNNFEALIAMGVLGFMFIHITINIGMNLALLPVTGIPLPFMSYGGSHILIGFISIGLVASFAKSHTDLRRTSKNEFLGLE